MKTIATLILLPLLIPFIVIFTHCFAHLTIVMWKIAIKIIQEDLNIKK